MTTDNLFEYRRWAQSMFDETPTNSKNANTWHYLKNWLENFDRIARMAFDYPEHHTVYKDGVLRLKELCRTL